MPHAFTGQAPLTAWDPTAILLTHLLPSGTAGSVPIPAIKVKGQLNQIARHPRYLYPLTSHTIIVLLTESLARATYTISDFHPVHPILDPTRNLHSSFQNQNLFTEPKPTAITPSTAAPLSTSHA